MLTNVSTFGNATRAAALGEASLLVATLLLQLGAALIFVSCAPPARGRAKLLSFLAAVTIGILVWMRQQQSLPQAAAVVGMLGYVSALTPFVYAVRRFSHTPLGRVGLFAGFCGTLVVLPGVLLPRPMSTSVQLFGWERMFAAYSFCRDTAGRRTTPIQCLSFVAAHPALVYSKRGEPVSEIEGRALPGLIRLAAGVATLAAHHALFVLTPWTAVESTMGSQRTAYPFLVGEYLFLIALYLGQSGRASVGIGLMRLAGHRVPEQFHFPVLATGPLDFWRRWNRYLGEWVRSYVLPSAARVLSKVMPGRKRAVVSSALFASFVFMGTVHAFGRWAIPGALQHGSGFRAFAAYGLAAALWLPLERGLRGTTLVRAIRRSTVLAVVGRIFSVVAFTHAFVLVVLLTDR